MNFFKQIRFIVFIISPVLFVAGFYGWSSFFLLMLPIVNDVNYLETDLTMPFQASLVFGLTLALIPVAASLVWKFAPIFKAGRKILTACIIVLAMMVAVVIRREVIKSQLTNLKSLVAIDYSDAANPFEKNSKPGFPVTDVKFEYFALVGVIAGSAISLFVLREKEE